jgi:hypothetical protein
MTMINLNTSIYEVEVQHKKNRNESFEKVKESKR